MAKLIRRKYVMKPRNGYYAIDEYQEENGKFKCYRFVLSCKTRKLANLITNELNWAIDNFCRDNKLKFIIGCSDKET